MFTIIQTEYIIHNKNICSYCLIESWSKSLLEILIKLDCYNLNYVKLTNLMLTPN